MSRHHTRWRNGEGKRQRARLERTLPAPCCRCGRPVLPTDEWEADHLVALVGWPEHQPYPDHLIRPAHKSCNRRAGGKDGAKITNNRRRAKSDATKGIRPW